MATKAFIQVNRTPRVKRALLEYVTASQEEKDAKARKEAARKILDEARDGAPEIRMGHRTVVRIATKSRTTVPVGDLRAQYPEIAAALQKVTPYTEYSIVPE